MALLVRELLNDPELATSRCKSCLASTCWSGRSGIFCFLVFHEAVGQVVVLTGPTRQRAPQVLPAAAWDYMQARWLHLMMGTPRLASQLGRGQPQGAVFDFQEVPERAA